MLHRPVETAAESERLMRFKQACYLSDIILFVCLYAFTVVSTILGDIHIKKG
jgi:hypothetical protein